MQSTFESLPPDLLHKIGTQYLSSDLLNVAKASKNCLKFFQPLLLIQKLLFHSICSEYEAVQSMLKNNLSLILERGNITDRSKRTFVQISAFEHALWALDKHMWASILECIPKNEEGQEILAALFLQYNKVKNEGVTYILYGKTIKEPHFDFENTILKELRTQIISINRVRHQDLDAIEKQWIEGVGGAQRLLPEHVVNEYCSNTSFQPTPQFAIPATSLKQFYNWITQEDEPWFAKDSMLGIDFAIHKSPGNAAGAIDSAYEHLEIGSRLMPDFVAIETLYRKRTTDFIELNLQLQAVLAEPPSKYFCNRQSQP